MFTGVCVWAACFVTTRAFPWPHEIDQPGASVLATGPDATGDTII